MNVQVHKETYATAWKRYEEYRDCSRRRHDSYLRSMRKAYWHLKRGKGIIDVSKAIASAGVNASGEPKLAIARADWKRVVFHKESDGAGSYRDSRWGSAWFRMRQHSFPEWPQRKADYGWETVRSQVAVPVPIVPAQYLPNGKLSNYAILFEVAEWEREIDKDPILLRRIEGNMFVVLASWDVTPIEQALISGRL